jgi:hypothetical protein
MKRVKAEQDLNALAKVEEEIKKEGSQKGEEKG